MKTNFTVTCLQTNSSERPEKNIKMLEQGRIKDETLFYNDMFNMTWEEAKEKYLTDVGR